MKKIRYLIILISFLSSNCFTQKALVIGFNYDSPDGIAIVALEDLPSTLDLFISETPYDALTNTFDRSTANKGTWKISWAGTWTKGTVIKFEGTSLTGTSGTGGPIGTPTAVSPYSDIVSLSNEGFSLFTASNSADPDATPTEIYSYTTFSKASVVDPDPNDDPDCPCAAEFISVDLNDSGIDHAEYKISLRTDGMPENIAEFENPANWDSGSTFQSLNLTAFNSIMLLPVVLISFEGIPTNGTVQLNWLTAIEINNDYFQIEHSINAQNFRSLGKVAGIGNADQPKNYSFHHQNPNTGINYYRLKQVDLDGQYTYSKIIQTQMDNIEGGLVYPNPTIGNFSLRAKDWTGKKLEIINASGQLIKKLSYYGSTIDISNFPAGIYWIRVEGTLLGEQILKVNN